MEKITKFFSAYKWYFVALIGLFVALTIYYTNKLNKEMKDTMNYINNNPEAADWKKLIQDKSNKNGLEYTAQLYNDVRYVVKNKYKGNPFTLFI